MTYDEIVRKLTRSFLKTTKILDSFPLLFHMLQYLLQESSTFSSALTEVISDFL